MTNKPSHPDGRLEGLGWICYSSDQIVDVYKILNTSLSVLSATQTLCSILLGVITLILSQLYIRYESLHETMNASQCSS